MTEAQTAIEFAQPQLPPQAGEYRGNSKKALKRQIFFGFWCPRRDSNPCEIRAARPLQAASGGRTRSQTLDWLAGGSGFGGKETAHAVENSVENCSPPSPAPDTMSGPSDSLPDAIQESNVVREKRCCTSRPGDRAAAAPERRRADEMGTGAAPGARRAPAAETPAENSEKPRPRLAEGELKRLLRAIWSLDFRCCWEQALKSGVPEEQRVSAASRMMCGVLGISAHAWRDAVEVMGDDAVLALAVLDRNRFRPRNPVLSPGGCLRGMTRKRIAGKLDTDTLRASARAIIRRAERGIQPALPLLNENEVFI